MGPPRLPLPSASEDFIEKAKAKLESLTCDYPSSWFWDECESGGLGHLFLWFVFTWNVLPGGGTLTQWDFHQGICNKWLLLGDGLAGLRPAFFPLALPKGGTSQCRWILLIRMVQRTCIYLNTQLFKGFGSAIVSCSFTVWSTLIGASKCSNSTKELPVSCSYSPLCLPPSPSVGTHNVVIRRNSVSPMCLNEPPIASQLILRS